MEENTVACNYEEMYKQKEAENRYLNMQLEEQGKRYENRINNLENDLSKYEKENKRLKDNWNKLKECLKDVMNSSNGDDKDFVETILNIIQELEQGSDNQ